jgi:sugar lactone lactonase YvrE
MTKHSTLHSVDCLWDVKAELGEGALWLAGGQGSGAVYFVDIKGRQLHRYVPATGARQSWPAPLQTGFMLPLESQGHESGGWVCGLSNGLAHFDEASGQFTPLCPVDAHRPHNRLNDGYVDAQGRIWFGSMDDHESDPTGTLYRFDCPGRLVPMDADYVITNGPAMSPDGRTLYHTDTLKRLVYAFDVDADGALSGKRVFVHLQSPGYPDGMAVDAEGCVWVAVFGGWRIDCFSPAGAWLHSQAFPCANITKLAFGGADLRTVYVTTAWKGLSAEQRAAQPLAGGFFSFESPVPGLPQHLIPRKFIA